MSFLREDISQTDNSRDSSLTPCNPDPTARKCNQSERQGQPPSKYRDGDWICSRCKNHNYSFRQTCNRCKKTAQNSTDVFFSMETSPFFYRIESDVMYGEYLRHEPNDSAPVYANYGPCLFYVDKSRAVNLRHQPKHCLGRADVQVESLSDRSRERSPNNFSQGMVKDLKSRDSLDTTDVSDVETTFYEKQILKSLLDD